LRAVVSPRRWLERLWHFRFRPVLDLERTARLLGPAKIVNMQGNPHAIRVGAHSIVRGELLTFAHGGSISIGEWCYVGEGTRIWSAARVVIGNRVLIAHNVNIHDTDSHPLDARQRHQHFVEIATVGHPRHLDTVTSAPVHIGDDVWIGFNAILLKGATVGPRTIIGAGSVVVGEVPPDSLYVRDRVVRRLER
jgi:acetyltransferase-like isoleucine patch superfamily enzyme